MRLKKTIIIVSCLIVNDKITRKKNKHIDKLNMVLIVVNEPTSDLLQ